MPTTPDPQPTALTWRTRRRAWLRDLLTLRPDAWREDLLDRVLLCAFVLGGVVCVPSVWFSLKQGLWGIAVLDAVAMGAVGGLAFLRRLGHARRAIGFGCVLLMVGAGLMSLVGPALAIYLLGFSVLTTMVLDARAGAWTVLVNAGVLVGIALAAPYFPESMTHPQILDRPTWAVISINVLFVNAALVFAVGPVLRALQRGLDRERRARASLEEREALLRMASRLGTLGAWRLNVADASVYLSEQARAIFELPSSYTPASGMMLDDFHEEDRPELESRLRRCMEHGEPYELLVRIWTRRGAMRWVRTIAEAVRGADGSVHTVHGTIQDVTPYREAERRLRESEARFRTLCAAANDAVFDWDVVRDSVWWNEHRELHFGAHPELRADGQEGAPGAGLASWAAHVHPEDLPRVLPAVKRVLEDGIDRWTGECRFLRADGAEAHVLNRLHVLRDAAGKPVRVIGWVTDLTERKRLENHLLRAQRMESIGTMAGGIAHDLNNVLTPIMASISFLRSEETDPEKLEDLQIMQSSARRGADMVRQLLSFARGRREGTQVQVDVAAVAKEVLQMVRETFPRGIEGSLTVRGHAPDAPEEVWPVLADPTQLHQVLTNLCVNARDAMPRGGTLSVKVESVTLDEGWTGLPGTLAPGPWVRLRVEDTGMGMSPEVMDRVFEPFFTTKELGKGTGLGLATSHTIVRNLGGAIHLYSEPGRGTRFEIYLPAHTGGEAPRASSVRPEPLTGKGELVLLAEDEEAVRQIAARTLERHGYRVLCAKNGEEALAAYRAHMPEVALVVTDMSMPLLDGPGTIAAIRDLDPSARFVASSGLSATETVAASPGLYFLEKPFTAEALLGCVREALAAPSTGPV